MPISLSSVVSAPAIPTPFTHSYAIRVKSVPTGTAAAVAPASAGISMVDLGRS
jgi:hypothetical protein